MRTIVLLTIGVAAAASLAGASLAQDKPATAAKPTTAQKPTEAWPAPER